MLSETAVAIAFAALVAAKPPRTKCEPRTLCIDGFNSCGVEWGGYETYLDSLMPISIRDAMDGLADLTPQML